MFNLYQLESAPFNLFNLQEIQSELLSTSLALSKFNENDNSRKRGYRVQSFGTGSCVKLPGVTVDKPNIYSFDTPYQDQFVDLKVCILVPK